MILMVNFILSKEELKLFKGTLILQMGTLKLLMALSTHPAVPYRPTRQYRTGSCRSTKSTHAEWVDNGMGDIA